MSATALTSTSTSPAPGAGTGTSASRMTSGPPCPVIRTARMVFAAAIVSPSSQVY
ncbi:hypothetical protein [Streptomyces sp. SPB78]|uniref:hypothetical protein n=1 Tax=Streptomyces sp. (strain SPB78) TaxID=591157 RepID=UPI001F3D431E|nr:hypothetical protein [Streptomyces sp. SPB78]